MERMGLDAGTLRAADPFKLSGGQQRRVALAGALAMDPQVLVLDEPAAGLDPAAREAMLSTIGGLRAAGTGILLVSHAMDDCARLCDRLVVLDAGRVVAAGTPAEVFADSAALAAHGLDAPAPQRLARALAKAGAPVPCPASLRTVDDLARAIVGA
jgi:energy-coupling factor transport system ATP-binding protein